MANNLFDIRTTGKKLVFKNSSDLYNAFNEIFTNKKLCSKITLSSWNAGTRNDYAYEAVKLLYYVFRKIISIHDSCNDKLISKYLATIDKFIHVISLSIKHIKFCRQTIEILTDLLNLFSDIKDIITVSKPKKQKDTIKISSKSSKSSKSSSKSSKSSCSNTSLSCSSCITSCEECKNCPNCTDCKN